MSNAWDRLDRRIVECRSCPRLVEHREHVAHVRRRQFRDDEYWGRPVTGFGDRNARLLIVGLAPAAHGANRTGRIFTGDRSGDWLYDALHDSGFANQPTSTRRDDGLELRDAFVTAIARCAPPGNRPTPEEIGNCRAYLIEELGRLRRMRVVLALGQLAMAGFLQAWRERGGTVPSPRPRFGHGHAFPLDPEVTLLTSYHPSQQNTFTGRLTRPMLYGVMRRASELVEKPTPPS
jgi:uracil-DNA glycosylase family 4